MDAFDLWNDGSDIPVFAWRLAKGHTSNWTLYDLSDRLRMKGWLVPAYPMPDNLTDVTVQRIVVRNGLSHDLASALLRDIRTEVRQRSFRVLSGIKTGCLVSDARLKFQLRAELLRVVGELAVECLMQHK